MNRLTSVTNWRKIVWRTLAALPAAYLAGGIVRLSFFITNSIHDMYQPIYQGLLTIADYGVMVAVLVSCLPRFKRTAAVLCGTCLVLISGYLLFLPFIFHNKGHFKLEECITHIPSLVFGFYCIIRYPRTKLIRNSEGIDEFKDSGELFNLF